MQVRNRIFKIWKDTCLAFGYEEYDSPAFEHLELYTQKSGQEIVSQLYCFEDKGGRKLALRPEITPTLARMVNQKGPSLKLPIRWFSIPRLHRYERSQKGRLREFFQLNLDIIGCSEIWAEIDLISAVIEMLQSFGLGESDFTVGISSRKVLGSLLRELHIPESSVPEVYAILDKRAKIPQEAFRQLLADAGLPDASVEILDSFFGCKDMAALEAWDHIGHAREGLSELQDLFSRLSVLGYAPFISLDLSVIRGLNYYTGIVFEVFDQGKNLRAIAGGGRYDNLLEHLGGQPMTGVGFGIGDVVLFEILKEKDLLHESEPLLDYYLVSFTGISEELLQLAGNLRRRGRRVSYSLQPGKLKKQLGEAEAARARKVIFFGSESAGPGNFEVKDMEHRTQAIVPFEDL